LASPELGSPEVDVTRVGEPASRKRRVVVISHDAYRAGSQICLLHVLRWLVGSYPADFSLLLRRGGALVEAYAEVLPTEVLSRPPWGDPRWRSIARGVARRLGVRTPRPVISGPLDLIYANSVPSLDVAIELASDGGCPVICHVHELNLAIQRYASIEQFREFAPRIDAFIAASEAVASNLVRQYGVAPEKIHQVYEAIAQPILRPEPRAAVELRARLGIPAEAFVVGGCGTVDWRKGPDIFLQVARSLAEQALPRPVHFVWVGGEPVSWERNVLEHDVARMGLSERVHLVGPQVEPAPYFSLFDVFVLTSREDPFPLVCLEAAALGIPIICFADAGGMPEFVGEDAGFVVPYLDVARASDRVRLLATAEELRVRLGRCAAERVKKHDVLVIGPKIASVLDRFLC
jgi:glycosyltransferase involved in cell wall biosynthesis